MNHEQVVARSLELEVPTGQVVVFGPYDLVTGNTLYEDELMAVVRRKDPRRPYASAGWQELYDSNHDGAYELHMFAGLSAGCLPGEPERKGEPGVAYVASGDGHTILSFAINPDTQSFVSVTAPGEGRPFEEMLELFTRDFRPAVERLQKRGLKIQLHQPSADDTYPYGDPEFHFTTENGKLVRDSIGQTGSSEVIELALEPSEEAQTTPDVVATATEVRTPLHAVEELPLILGTVATAPLTPPEIFEATREVELQPASEIVMPTEAPSVLEPPQKIETVVESQEPDCNEGLPRLGHYNNELNDLGLGSVTAMGCMEAYARDQAGEYIYVRNMLQGNDVIRVYGAGKFEPLRGHRTFAQGLDNLHVRDIYRRPANAPFAATVSHVEGRGFLIHGITPEGEGFSAVSFPITTRPGQQVTFVVEGKGRSFAQVVEAAKQDFPAQFDAWQDQGIEVRLAEPTELGSGVVGWPRIPRVGDEDSKPLLPILQVVYNPSTKQYDIEQRLLPPLAN